MLSLQLAFLCFIVCRMFFFLMYSLRKALSRAEALLLDVSSLGVHCSELFPYIIQRTMCNCNAISCWPLEPNISLLFTWCFVL
jgi:hypothetical protein